MLILFGFLDSYIRFYINSRNLNKRARPSGLFCLLQKKRRNVSPYIRGPSRSRIKQRYCGAAAAGAAPEGVMGCAPVIPWKPED
jgi:hypothetical protein